MARAETDGIARAKALGKVLMIQGTASSVGKSLMVAALCRIYTERGLRVAPFKSQNMALNSFVTAEGHEIGRAQAVQAAACRRPPSVQMNPILLKPERGNACQVIVQGELAGRMSADQYHEHRPRLAAIIKECLDHLRSENDLVIIEGAGSPVEINLKDRDIANMFVAELADAPVVLVGDIDRGGVFASLVGTMALLEGSEKARVAGFIFNKFRGDPTLLGDGPEMLRQRTGVPVLGVVPHIEELALPDEDSTSLEARDARFSSVPGAIEVAVIQFPHISNYDDLLPLEREAGVRLRFVREAEPLRRAQLVVLPGSKCSMADLEWLRASPMHAALLERAELGQAILGICGGFQMLGMSLSDPLGVESTTGEMAGLALLPISTRFGAEKTRAQIFARSATPSFLGTSEKLRGYEIHMGQIEHHPGARPLLQIESRNGVATEGIDGAVQGRIAGTMMHGIFDNDGLRAALLEHLGCESGPLAAAAQEDAEFARLAETVRRHLLMSELDRIIGLRP